MNVVKRLLCWVLWPIFLTHIFLLGLAKIGAFGETVKEIADELKGKFKKGDPELFFVAFVCTVIYNLAFGSAILFAVYSLVKKYGVF